jgi:hypothetical protein
METETSESGDRRRKSLSRKVWADRQNGKGIARNAGHVVWNEIATQHKAQAADCSRSLQSRHRRVHGTASSRALEMGEPHDAHTPNRS